MPLVAGMRGLSRIKTKADVRLACAQRLPFADAEFDAIVTDPPYYDNLYYNALADFFFTWKRLLFHAIDPDLFSAPQTNDATELVASTKRSGNAAKAHADYCQKLGGVMREAERVLKRDGVFALLYSHGALSGWEAIIQAYRATGLIITSVQPLSIERKQRPRAMTSEAVNTCVVFVARHGQGAKQLGQLDAISTSLRQSAEMLKASLSEAGWNDDDIGVAIYSQAVGMLANVAGVCGVSDRESLIQLAAVVRTTIPTFKVADRKPL